MKKRKWCNDIYWQGGDWFGGAGIGEFLFGTKDIPVHWKFCPICGTPRPGAKRQNKEDDVERHRGWCATECDKHGCDCDLGQKRRKRQNKKVSKRKLDLVYEIGRKGGGR
jgi:hypothetical protein